MKPALEKIVGKYLHVFQHGDGPSPYLVQQAGTKYQDVDPSLFDPKGWTPVCVVRDYKDPLWGSCSFEVLADGSLKYYRENWDSSD